MNPTTEAASTETIIAPPPPESEATPEPVAAAPTKKAAAAPPVETFELVDFPMADIVLPEKNVRATLPDVKELAASIKAEGIIEPLVGARLEDGFKVLLIAGHRRYYAAKELKLTSVPMRIVVADEARRHRMAIIENLQRADMNAMDKATSIAEMIEKESLEQKDAAIALGVSEGFISQHLALLRLPKKIQGAVRSGTLDMASARQLGRVKDEEKALEFFALAGSLTSAGLADKIDLYVQKEKEKEAKVAAAAKKKEKAATRKKLGVKEADDDEDDAPKTLAQEYADKKIEPLKKTDMTEALKYYASRYERASSDAKKMEYKFTLKGLEIAAGLSEFTAP